MTSRQTIRHRLLVSNVIMVVVPVLVTALVGLACLAVMLNTASHKGLGLDSESDFYWAGTTAAELVENTVGNAEPASVSYDGVTSVLQGQGLDLAVIEDGDVVFSTSGITGTDLSFALAASATGESPVTMRSGERTMFLKAEAAEDGATSYQVAVFGSLTEVADSTIKQMAVASAFILALTAALSVYLVNRFCHRYVFDRIEWSLGHLEEGVQQLSAGNLSYRIRYDRDDEFRPIADSFDRMTAQLQASEERQRRDQRNRQELIACISHDLRSPLTSIRGYAEGLRDGIATTPQMRERYATRIASKAEEMDGLVSELFMFSKLDLGDFPHEERPVRVDTFLQNVLDNLAPELERTGNTLAQVELTPATVLADERLLRQAVTNVLLNASKHAPGSAITVRASVAPDGSHVDVAITDNGPGVPEESLGRIFEVFYRTDPSRTAASGGSGLGLAIVQRAMRAMGGEATAESIEPHGLRVILTLRVTGQKAAENSTREASA
ncbi:sensor histidine kinase [Olsenella sp. AF16-14LB]|jgi:signal transduction histidine kinase|uniref:sensor histidine kinase n=1 Tax=unclassified Olsenella TaxID=2638792 RepID=UPI000509DB1D|nr:MULTISPECIES: HAMP domain-containing sensor histidine kinase [unclassified Olsenella]RGU49257.1 sensor histidine kinase [Olsenella sp. AF16-14LB]RGU81832.1 sensor histidine kinase [Olsenella sp. AF15-43LB]RHB56256.1 sensor histidine kinase [Olsenella sp. AM39-30AC]